MKTTKELNARLKAVRSEISKLRTEEQRLEKQSRKLAGCLCRLTSEASTRVTCVAMAQKGKECWEVVRTQNGTSTFVDVTPESLIFIVDVIPGNLAKNRLSGTARTWLRGVSTDLVAIGLLNDRLVFVRPETVELVIK